MKKWHKKVAILIFFAVSLSFLTAYVLLLNEGKKVYTEKRQRVEGWFESNPAEYKTIFNEIFTSALNCQRETQECVRMTRTALDQFASSNQSPVYFIQILPDGRIAKMFYSGDIILEKVDTREEKMVVDLIEGRRPDLYGPYLGQEAFDIKYTPEGKIDYSNRWLMPAFLKDLYAQIEVIVPYTEDGVKGGVVYLHGQ